MLLNISMVIEEYVFANIPMRTNKDIVHTGNTDKDMGPVQNVGIPRLEVLILEA